jgi:hypothetical protein
MSLLDVALGGGLAIAGGVGATFLTQRLAAREAAADRERAALFGVQEMFDELVGTHCKLHMLSLERGSAPTDPATITRVGIELLSKIVRIRDTEARRLAAESNQAIIALLSTTRYADATAAVDAMSETLARFDRHVGFLLNGVEVSEV